MKKIILLLVLATSLAACKKEDSDKVGFNEIANISKVKFSQTADKSGTIFSFTVTVNGDYQKLALWSTMPIDHEISSISFPKTGAYSLTDVNLPFGSHIPNYNYFVWTKKDGSTFKYAVMY